MFLESENVLVRTAAFEVHGLFPFFLPDIYALPLCCCISQICAVYSDLLYKIIAEINLSKSCLPWGICDV